MLKRLSIKETFSTLAQLSVYSLVVFRERWSV